MPRPANTAGSPHRLGNPHLLANEDLVSNADPAGAPVPLPLSALLSQLLVALTVELDNEFEARMPHRTTVAKPSAATSAAVPRSAPWLTSFAMYQNCLRFLDPDGVSVAELEGRARTPSNLNGMVRWGLITVAPPSTKAPAARPGPPRGSSIVRPTRMGLLARETWKAVCEVVPPRWDRRFGSQPLTALDQSLRQLVAELDPSLPDCLPILGYGLFTAHTPEGKDIQPVSHPSLPALLSRVLVAFAVEFESRARRSLAVSANVLRPLFHCATPLPLRELPRLGGISKEAVRIALGLMQKQQLVMFEPATARGRGQAALLTPQGRDTYRAHLRLLKKVEHGWRSRFSAGLLGELRLSLERLVGDGTPQGSPLFEGLAPCSGCWRSRVPAPAMLPHFPMVLHRGGYPDGS